MKKRVPLGQPANHAHAPSHMWEGHTDVPWRGAPTEGRRLTDLFGVEVHSPELLDELRRIHWLARQVIGGNLGRRSLQRATLERLRASVF